MLDEGERRDAARPHAAVPDARIGVHAPIRQSRPRQASRYRAPKPSRSQLSSDAQTRLWFSM
ncbi:hypothetical protein WK33_26180 [Burkholderia multivorans]|nr:hypothetical protein WK22_19350 [Burkholderia multivorans]EJO52164.1 hypothetical protein BURMUCF1_A0242 [Burkholderia multivorans ATCC BAA-247]KVS08679.1 hypothetical protein WK33_26180 [Burkholderia multivorans]